MLNGRPATHVIDMYKGYVFTDFASLKTYIAYNCSYQVGPTWLTQDKQLLFDVWLELIDSHDDLLKRWHFVKDQNTRECLAELVHLEDVLNTFEEAWQ